jgi:hypothetical protein
MLDGQQCPEGNGAEGSDARRDEGRSGSADEGWFATWKRRPGAVLEGHDR